ncbi:hypothetical protein BH11ACT4_BH11ACT4_18130 [soil metagenome]
MSDLPEASRAALAPLRTYLSATAQAAATLSHTSADGQAATILADAATTSESIRAAAAAEGEAAANSAAALVSARARRQAHETVLRSQNDIRLDLKTRATTAAQALTADPRYPALVAHLTARAHALLGPEALISTSPAGGVIAVAGSRRIDLSLAALAERTLDSLTEENRSLWMP